MEREELKQKLKTTVELGENIIKKRKALERMIVDALASGTLDEKSKKYFNEVLALSKDERKDVAKCISTLDQFTEAIRQNEGKENGEEN